MIKILIFLLIIVVIIFRINLAPNDNVSDALITKSENIVEKTIMKMMLSDSIADWRYIDFLVVKFACSERLEATFIAIPFLEWLPYNDEYEICTPIQ